MLHHSCSFRPVSAAGQPRGLGHGHADVTQHNGANAGVCAPCSNPATGRDRSLTIAFNIQSVGAVHEVGAAGPVVVAFEIAKVVVNLVACRL